MRPARSLAMPLRLLTAVLACAVQTPPAAGAAAAPGMGAAPAAAEAQPLAEWPVTGPAVPRNVSLYCRREAGVGARLTADPGESFPGGTGALRFDMGETALGAAPTDAQVSFVTAEWLGRGGRYEVRFWVRASAAVSFRAAARLHEAPWSLLAAGSEVTVEASPAWGHVAIPFSMTEDLPADVEIRCPGLLLGALPAGTTLWLAGVRLCEIEPPALPESPELLRNPGFEEGLQGWAAQASELALAPGLGCADTTACRVQRRTARWGSPAQDIRDALLAAGQRVYDMRAAVRRVSGRGEAFLVVHIRDGRGERWVVGPKRRIGADEYTALRARRPLAWVEPLQAADLSLQTTGDDAGDLLADDLSLRAVPGTSAELRVVPPPPADLARRETRTLVGAIRWDGWCGDRHRVGLDLERVLAPPRYHYRLPFFAVVGEAGAVQVRCTAQEVMDREIAFAREAGLDYWAFDWYPPGSGLALARDLYLASPRRGSLRWCAILGTGLFTDNDRAWLVEQFRTPHYQCVAGGRPLVYVFDAGPKHAALVQGLRQEASRAGVAQPFVVVMGWSAAVADAADACGADALGAYVTPLGRRSPFAANMEHERAQWRALLSTGRQMVPTVTTGWDPRPFLDCPVDWYPPVSGDHWVEPAAPAEIAAQLREAIAFANAHPEATLANTVLIYAWNENAEGGWIVPTLHELRDAGYPLRLDAVRSVLRPEIPPGTSWEPMAR